MSFFSKFTQTRIGTTSHNIYAMSMGPNNNFSEDGALIRACPFHATDGSQLWPLTAITNQPVNDFMAPEGSNLSPSVLTDDAPLRFSHMKDVAGTPDSTQEVYMQPLSKRVRRPSATSLPGNNRHGRQGKLRCQQCRAWKQKVSYLG